MLGSVCNDGYSLEDSMQAHEINDAKIDPKHDLSPESTISHWIANKKVRAPEILTIPEIRSIYKRILKFEAQVVRGNPLTQTIYTFVYFTIKFQISIRQEYLQRPSFAVSAY